MKECSLIIVISNLVKLRGCCFNSRGGSYLCGIVRYIISELNICITRIQYGRFSLHLLNYLAYIKCINFRISQKLLVFQVVILSASEFWAKIYYVLRNCIKYISRGSMSDFKKKFDITMPGPKIVH